VLSILGLLLTEIKILGLAIRSPILSFYTKKTKDIIFGIFLLCVCIVYFLFFDQEVSFEKGNLITFIVVSFGGIFLFYRSPFVYDYEVLRRYTLRIYVGFAIFSIWQMHSFTFLDNFFAINKSQFFGRASGLSGEPSFFVWMAGYFFIIGQLFDRNTKILSYVFIGVILFTTRSTTAIFIPIIYLIFKLCNNIKLFKKDRISIVILSILLLVIIDRVFYFFNLGGLGFLTLKYLGSWREMSNFSALFSSELIGPFSGGSLWGEYIIKGQYYQIPDHGINFWITQPWSFFSMWAVEIGIIPTITIIYILGRRFFKRMQIYNESESSVFMSFIFIALFLAPKWCVYFFILPKLCKNRGGNLSLK
jgi:hypothetical protein